MASIFLLLLLLLAHVKGFVYESGVSFNTGTNVTLSEPESRFNYRQNTYAAVGGYFTDISLEIGSSEVNGIIGAAYCLPLGFPTLYMAFFNVSTDAVFGSSASATSVSAATGFVSMVMISLNEVTSDGAVIASYNFDALSWTQGSLVTVDPTRGLVSNSFTTTLSNGATLAITVAASSVLGVLNDGGAYITPSSLESFFEVNGYVLASGANHLRLTFYLVDASSVASIVTNQKVTAGAGASQIYMYVANSAQVGGSSQTATVGGLTNAGISIGQVPSTQIINQVQDLDSMQVGVREVTVDFVAGSVDITYDPAIGFADPTFTASTPTKASAASILNVFDWWILLLIVLNLVFY